jgi:hypothetical protein
MFFFFFDQIEFRPGQRCEIVKNDPRHITMPLLFPDRIGEKVIISTGTKHSDYVWAHDFRPVTYRTNSRGREVVEFDPRCVISPFPKDSLRVMDMRTVNEWLNST